MARRFEITEAVSKSTGGALSAVSGASVAVKDLRGNNLTVFSGETGAGTLANPLASDAAGRIEGWVEAPDFDLTISGTGITTYAQKVRTSPLDVYHWNSYGAKGDGSTNDAPSIQAALDAADAAGGGTVRAGQGDYLVTSALTVGSNVTVSGEGWGSTLKCGGPVHAAGSINGLSAVSKSRVTVEALRILGPEDGTMTTANGADAGRGIFFDAVTDFVIRDVHVSRFNIQGIYLGACVRGKVSGCTVLEIYSGNGISVDGLAADVVIAGNNLASIADDGIGTHNGALRTVIANNTITNTNFGRGIDIYGAPDTLVIGNTIRDVGGSGSAGQGIQIYPGLSSTVPHRCQVIGNQIRGCAQSGIVVDATSDIYDTLIVGNHIESCGGTGMTLSRTWRRLQIVGNQVVANTGTGIYLSESGAATGTQGQVVGNMVRDNGGWGIHATASISDTQIAANYVKGNTSGEYNTPSALFAANADTSGAALAALETEVNELKATMRLAGLIA